MKQVKITLIQDYFDRYMGIKGIKGIGVEGM
jgi:hypothetical protein